MPKIVQFCHPGDEHDVGDLTHKSWNIRKGILKDGEYVFKSDHKRKFIKSTGSYVDNENTKHENKELVFWGEWEPPSNVEELRLPEKIIDCQKTVELYPHFLHIPYLPDPIPNPYVNLEINSDYYENTDPCVFGKQFKYFTCHQMSRNSRFLANLEIGSVILFGSAKSAGIPKPVFQVDTVFVIESYIEYSPSDPDAKSKILEKHKDLENYLEYSFDMAFPDYRKYPESLKLRLYFGATFDNPVNGMYSYSPAKVWSPKDNIGFPRIQISEDLNLSEYINPTNTQAAKGTELHSLDEAVKFWKSIRKISRAQGCVEGVEFTEPQRKAN